MITISLCMIVRDEENELEPLMNAVTGVFDEVVVVDTGSSDHTLSVAQKYTDKVRSFPTDNRASARNLSFSMAECDFVVWLNAEDRLSAVDLLRLRQLKKILTKKTDVVMMRHVLSVDANGYPTLSTYRERMIRRNAGFHWLGAANEYIPIEGKILYSGITITRETVSYNDNLRIYRSMIDKGEAFLARDTLYYARELLGAGALTEAAAEYENFLSTLAGRRDIIAEACFELASCYRFSDRDKMLAIALGSLRFSPPRAEICCLIGEYQFYKEQYPEAVYWYEQALRQERPFRQNLFFDDFWGYVPALQLCLCWYHLGNEAKAVMYNSKAKEFKPNDPSVLSNERFFSEKKDEIKDIHPYS